MVSKKSSFLFVSFIIMLLILMPFISASHPATSYNFLIGSGPLEEFGPVISVASNGDTIELKGEGTFNTKPKTIKGNGTFIHRDSEGNVLGTGKWVTTKLISFKPYGNGIPQELPEEFEGGRALIKVLLDPDETGPSFDGTLTITCTLGNKIPPKAKEGIRLAVRGLPINFNEESSGAVVFIRTA